MLYLLYPRPYLPEVKNAAETFAVNEDVLFGLIRTESYFDKTIASRAGATGLAQLMDATANDIAKKLKKAEKTILNQRASIYSKLDIHDRYELMETAKILGLVF